MQSTRSIALRAVVTAFEVMLAVVLVGGLTPADLEPDAVELMVLAGLGAGLSVIYNSAREWLDQTKVARGLRSLRRERDRQRAELEASRVIPDEPEPPPVLDLSASTRQRRPWRRT